MSCLSSSLEKDSWGTKFTSANIHGVPAVYQLPQGDRGENVTTPALMRLQDNRQEGGNSHLLEPSKDCEKHFTYVISFVQ